MGLRDKETYGVSCSICRYEARATVTWFFNRGLLIVMVIRRYVESRQPKSRRSWPPRKAIVGAGERGMNWAVGGLCARYRSRSRSGSRGSRGRGGC